MKQKEDILKKLRDHAIAPPGELFAQISAAAGMEAEEDADNQIKHLNLLRDHTIPVPSALEQLLMDELREQQAVYSQKLATLQKHEVERPAGVYESIWNRIRKTGSTGSGKVIHFLGKYRAAAAVIVAVLMAAIIYRMVSTTPTIADQGLAGNKASKEQPTPFTTPVTDTIVAGEGEADKNWLAYYRQQALQMKKENPFYSNTIQIDGWSQKIGQQDMLAAFASYRYEDIPAAFWNKGEKEMVAVQVDDFTAIGISADMRSMMKKMYEVKKNGKPTHKAKREKRKLKRWMKADKKRFDKTLSSNPLDPIDLANFIFD